MSDDSLSTDDLLPQDTKYHTQTVREHSETIDALWKKHTYALFSYRYGMSHDEYIERHYGTPLATGVRPGVKFDTSYLVSTKTTSPPATPYSYNSISEMYEDLKQNYFYAAPSPYISYDITAYAQLTQPMYRTMSYGTLLDEEQPQQPEEAPVAETRKMFRYSKYKDKSYKDSMVFWLKNMFKDDILACAETNS